MNLSSPSHLASALSPSMTDTFPSLRSRNFRLLVAGLLCAQSGSSVQLVAIAWVALQVTGDGTALGWVVAAAYAPMLLLAPWAGSLADRHDKRALLVGVQIVAVALAVVLAGLMFAGAPTGALLGLLALGHGAVHAVEIPVRRAFAVETVPRSDSTNAASLTTTVSMVSRIVGPVVAGVLLVVASPGWCFVAAAAFYLVALPAPVLMRRSELYGASSPAPHAGSVRAGLRYVARVPELRVTLLLTAVVCTFGFNHQVVVPLLADRALGGDAGTYALLYTAMTVGAALGGLAAARRTSVHTGSLARDAIVFGAATGLLAVAPGVAWAALAAAGAGATGLLFVCGSTAVLQRCDPEMRGRVMALSTVALFGGLPVGGPLLGLLCETLGPRAGLAVAAAVVVVAGACVGSIRAAARMREASSAVHPMLISSAECSGRPHRGTTPQALVPGPDQARKRIPDPEAEK